MRYASSVKEGPHTRLIRVSLAMTHFERRNMSVKTFVDKLYYILEQQENTPYVSWVNDDSFAILDIPGFSEFANELT